MEKFTLLSTHCPKCKVLEKKLNSLNAEYDIVDNIDEINKLASEIGIREAPILISKDGPLTFKDAVKYLNNCC